MVTVANASTNADLGACWQQSIYRPFVANEGNDNQLPNEVKVMAM